MSMLWIGCQQACSCLCLVALLPLTAIAKPPDLPVGLRVVCIAQAGDAAEMTMSPGAAAHAGTPIVGEAVPLEEAPATPGPGLIDAPDPGSLLLAPVEDLRQVEIRLRFDRNGRPHWSLRLAHNPSALPAFLAPQEKKEPLPPDEGISY